MNTTKKEATAITIAVLRITLFRPTLSPTYPKQTHAMGAIRYIWRKVKLLKKPVSENPEGKNFSDKRKAKWI
jgi:hypothetical protein